MNSHKPDGFFQIPSYIHVLLNILYTSDFMIVKYMIKLNQNCAILIIKIEGHTLKVSSSINSFFASLSYLALTLQGKNLLL